MRTVGEMVNERIALQARQCRGGIANEADSYFRVATAPIMALQSLGIWDAEVQWAQWHGEGYTDYDLLQVWGDTHPRSRASEEPGAFRVIVLPKEEK